MPLTFTWTVSTTALALPSPAGLSSGVVEATPRRLRRGFLRPFRRDGAGSLATGTGEDLDRAQLELLLGADRGPRWDGGMHASTDKLRNIKNNQTLADFASVFARDAIEKYLPHLILISLTAVRDANILTLTATAQRREELATTKPRVVSATASIQVRKEVTT